MLLIILFPDWNEWDLDFKCWIEVDCNRSELPCFCFEYTLIIFKLEPLLDIYPSFRSFNVLKLELLKKLIFFSYPLNISACTVVLIFFI